MFFQKKIIFSKNFRPKVREKRDVVGNFRIVGGNRPITARSDSPANYSLVLAK